MASNQTENYGLNQWLATDQVVHPDFNADNAKIDAALAGKVDQTDVDELAETVPKLVAGSYTGDGAATQTITLGFTPKVVLVFSRRGYTTAPGLSNILRYYGGLAVTDGPAISGRSITVVAIQTNGFQVTEDADNYVEANETDEQYYYLALG